MNRLPHHEAMAKNKQLPCYVEGCASRRASVGRFCERHRKLNARNGHPLQRRIHPSAYATERHQVEELFLANPNHPGVLLASVWVQEWMASSFPEDLSRLNRYGVTPLDILAGVAAMWLYQQSHPDLFVSERAADFALSLAVLSLAPKDNQAPFKNKARRELGIAFRTKLESLFMGMQAALNTTWDDLGAAFEATNRPFTYSGKFFESRQDT